MVGSLGSAFDYSDVTDGSTTVKDPDSIKFEQGVTDNGDGTATVPGVPYSYGTYSEPSAGFTVGAGDYVPGGNFYLLDASAGGFTVNLENPSNGQGRVGIKLNYTEPAGEVQVYQKTWDYGLTHLTHPHDFIVYEWHGFWVAVTGGNAYGHPRTTIRDTTSFSSLSVTPLLQHVNEIDTTAAGGQVTVSLPNTMGRSALVVHKTDAGGNDVVIENFIASEKARLTTENQYVKLVNGSDSWNAVAGGTLPV